MRKIQISLISDFVYNSFQESNYKLPSYVKRLLEQACKTEKNPDAKKALNDIILNSKIAQKESMPVCQDTGLAVIMIELGTQVCLTGGDLRTELNKAVGSACQDGYLRPSVAEDPFVRVNSGNNTPAFIHTELVPGDQVKITVVPKGGGCENMSFVRMLSPSAGSIGVEDAVVDWIERSGTNPCPPLMIGIGLGGSFDRCAYLAKKALVRGSGSKKKFYRDMEKRLLKKINSIGIGPQTPGGGGATALAVHIESEPCHIASLPLAVNLNCHASRYAEVVL